MLTIVGIRTSTESASEVEQLAKESIQNESFVSIPLISGTVEIQFQGFVGETIVGQTREEQHAVVPLGDKALRDSHRPTIILHKKTA